MRGHKQTQINVACLINVEALIPPSHPIRVIKRMLVEVLGKLDSRFAAMYAQEGRPSIPPERLLLAKVLMALYTIRSERQFCERLQYDLLFRWFLDLNPDEPVFDHSSFSANQARLLAHAVADEFFISVVQLARERGWVADDHFSVDATLIDAWASLKSVRPKEAPRGPGDGNGWVDFRGQARTNDTHASTTDPEAKLARKGDGQEARLRFAAHAAMDNRSGLCVLMEVHPAAGAPDSEVAAGQVDTLRRRGFQPRVIAGDRGYGTRKCVHLLREKKVIPHCAPQRPGYKLGIKVHSAAYRLSQRCRRRIEEIFGWMKTTGGLRKSRHRGTARVHAAAQYVTAACNLVRMARMALGPPGWKAARA